MNLGEKEENPFRYSPSDFEAQTLLGLEGEQKRAFPKYVKLWTQAKSLYLGMVQLQNAGEALPHPVLIHSLTELEYFSYRDKFQKQLSSSPENAVAKMLETSFPIMEGLTNDGKDSILTFMQSDTENDAIDYFQRQCEYILRLTTDEEFRSAKNISPSEALLPVFLMELMTFNAFANNRLPSELIEDIEVNDQTKKAIDNRYTIMVNKLNQHQNFIRKLIFEKPHSDEAQTVKSSLLDLIASGAYEYTTTLLLGVTPRNLLEFCRECIKHEEGDNAEAEFFATLKQNAFDFYKKQGFDVYSSEELEEFTSDSENSTATDITSLELKKVVGNIFSKSSEREYSVNPVNIDWEFFAQPTTISLQFDSSRQTRFTITFTWKSEEGEIVMLGSKIDTKREGFEWSLLENHESPAFQPLKWALLTEAKKVLLDAAQQAEELNKTRKIQINSKSQPIRNPKPQIKKERASDPIYKLRKMQPEQEFQLTTKPSPAFELKPKITMSIIDTDGALYEKMPTLNPEVQNVVVSAIHRFNEIGGNHLSRKIRRGTHGEPRYTLSVRTPAGDIRVLVHEVESVKGERKFEVIDIDHRKNIYKKPSYRS